MNETLKTIAQRYSCRDFADTPVTDEQVETIVKAGLAAPSGNNSQPWHIIIIRDKAFLDGYDVEGMSILAAMEDKTMYERMMGRGGKLIYNTPCMAMILSNGAPPAMLDCGILCQTVVLAAQSLGLNTCVVGMGGIPLKGAKGKEYKERLKFPEGYDYAIGVLIGTGNSGKEPHELDMAKVTYINS